MPVTGNNRKEVPGCWSQDKLRKVLFPSYGRTEIQPCRAHAQACLRGPDEAGKVWIQHLGNIEAERERVFSI